MKSKMDMQSGFWQVRLTDQSKSLTSFADSQGNVYRFNVLPMGLSISPGVFQLYTSRHVRNFKNLPEIKKLMKAGAVLEVLMDDFLLGSADIPQHLRLLEAWFQFNQKTGIFFKQSKCEFLKEELDVLGRRVGSGWWKPLEDRLESICVTRPKNRHDLQSLLGSVNWVRRHITDVQPTFALSSLLRKGKKWQWEEEHEQAWLDLQKNLAKALAVAVPCGDNPMFLVTDASDLGGGGSILQLQGEQMRFLGHWAWKWSGARSRYAAFEKELLAGVLLLAAQKTTLATASSVVWITDAAGVVDFCKADPPMNNKRRLRWWYFLRGFNLEVRYVPGIKNEWADYLSRQQFENRTGLVISELAKQEFERMDAQLDLALVPISLNSHPDVPWLLDDVLAEQPQLAKLKEKNSLYLDDQLWTVVDGRVYCETQLYVPEKNWEVLISLVHEKMGHPGLQAFWAFWRRRYVTLDVSRTNAKAKALLEACATCRRAKPNSSADRGRPASLPVPLVKQAEVAVDLIVMPDQSKVLFICETLTGFVQAVPLSGNVSEEEAAKAFWEGWIAHYGAPGRITSDNEIRWAHGGKGPWYALLEAYGIEMHLCTPYRSASNGRLERRVQEYRKAMRMLHLDHPRIDWRQLNPLTVALLNGKPGRCGVSPSEMFLNMPQWYDLAIVPPAASSSSQIGTYQHAMEAVRSGLVQQRRWRISKMGKGVSDTKAMIGGYVLVHHSRFPGNPHTKVDSPWLGPFLVTELQGRAVVFKLGTAAMRVDLSKTKVWPYVPDSSSAQVQVRLPQVNQQQAEQRGYYNVEAIEDHLGHGGEWYFKVRWQGYAAPTWEPLAHFVLPTQTTESGKRLHENLAEYLQRHHLAEAQEAARLQLA